MLNIALYIEWLCHTCRVYCENAVEFYDNRVLECTAVNKNAFCKSRKCDANVLFLPV